MDFFKDGHMTRAAQRLDEIMAAEGQYWDAKENEYRHFNQDTPGKGLVVHYLPPFEVQIEPVREPAKDSTMEHAAIEMEKVS